MRKVVCITAAVLLRAFSSIAASAVSAERPLSPPFNAPAAYQQTDLRIASDGREFLVIWSDYRSRPQGPPDLYATRLDSVGGIIEPNIKLASGVAAGDIVWGGLEYLVAAREVNGGISIQRVSRTGIPLESPRPIITGSDGSIRLASTGAGYALVSADAAGDGRYRVTLINFDDNTVRTIPLRLKPPTLVDTFVALNGTYYLFYEDRTYGPGACVSGCNISLRRIAIKPNGDTLDEPIFENLPVSNRTYASVVGNNGILLAWQHDQGNARFVEWVFVSDNPLPVQPLSAVYVENLLGRIDATTDLLSAGFDGSEYLITFAAPLNASQNALGAIRLNSRGELIDNRSGIISTAAPESVDIASSSTHAVVVWSEQFGGKPYKDAVSRAVPSFAELMRRPMLSSAISRSSAVQTGLRLSGGNNGPLVVWREFDVRPAIMASFAGSGPSILIAGRSDLDQNAPAVTYLGRGYLVVWREDAGTSFRILGRRVGERGELLDTLPIVIASEQRKGPVPPVDRIDLASNGETAVVAWSAGDNTIHAARVFSTGALLDPMPLIVSRSEGFAIRQSVHVLWTGSDFIVAWSHDPNNPLSGAAPVNFRTEIYASRVGANGSVDAANRLVAQGGYFGRRITLAVNEGRIGIAWTAVNDLASAGRCLYFQQLTTGLVSLGPGDSPIFCRNEDSAPMELSLAGEPNGFLLLAAERENIIAYRFGAVGQFPEEFVVSAAGDRESEPAAIRAGSVTLVVYGRVSETLEHGGVTRAFMRTIGVAGPGRQRAVRR